MQRVRHKKTQNRRLSLRLLSGLVPSRAVTMQSSTQLRRFTLPANRLKYVLACAVLLFAGCGVSDEEIKSLRSEARKGWNTWPVIFDSTEAATTYAHALPVGGRVDQVRIGLDDFLVIFAHGSGVPVVNIAVYRRNLLRWERVAQPPRPPFSDHLTATAAGGKIMVTGQRTGSTWVLYDPNEPKN